MLEAVVGEIMVTRSELDAQRKVYIKRKRHTDLEVHQQKDEVSTNEMRGTRTAMLLRHGNRRKVRVPKRQK